MLRYNCPLIDGVLHIRLLQNDQVKKASNTSVYVSVNRPIKTSKVVTGDKIKRADLKTGRIQALSYPCSHTTPHLVGCCFSADKLTIPATKFQLIMGIAVAISASLLVCIRACTRCSIRDGANGQRFLLHTSCIQNWFKEICTAIPTSQIFTT